MDTYDEGMSEKGCMADKYAYLSGALPCGPGRFRAANSVTRRLRTLQVRDAPRSLSRAETATGKSITYFCTEPYVL